MVVVGVTLATLTGCSGAVSLEPAAGSNDPDCAAVTVRLPDTVSDLVKRETTAQATGAWGNPAAVLLHCGVATPAPTTDTCVSVNDIDWVEDDSKAPIYSYTTYGRTPAVEVVIDSRSASSTALDDLTAAVSVIPQDKKCIGATEVDQIPTSTPAPESTQAPTPTP